jgi:hypothetical protein
LLFNRDFRADGATGAGTGWLGTEKACPAVQPLIDSCRAVAVHAADVAAVALKRPVTPSDRS